MNQYSLFRHLHRQQTPLLLGNVWDVNSAKACQTSGFTALGTSSAAVAGMLGYEDGEQMPFEQLLAVVKRIRATVDLPLSVDLEGGYSRNTDQIIANLARLSSMGVAGINLEDSVVDKQRHILPIDDFSRIVKTIKMYLQNHRSELFLNIRTDTYLLGVADALAETKQRAKAYQEAGADGIFVPGVVAGKAIGEIARSTSLPLNVMCLPGLPSIAELTALGVKRVSMGNFVHSFVNKVLHNTLLAIQQQQSFQILFSNAH